jgi:hypothetical protein
MEALKSTGEVHVWLSNSKGKKLHKLFVGKNLVVALGKQNVARLLGGHNSGKVINKVQAGSSNAVAADADTAITNAVDGTVTAVSYPSTNQVKFDFTFTGAALGGMVVKELGLLNDANVLCARKTTADLSVPTGLSLTGFWIITINS